MDNGHDPASCALRWDNWTNGDRAVFLRLLREHASTLRQLHVA